MMKKRMGLISIILAAAGLAGAISSSPSPDNEWNFYSDPVGTPLPAAYNSLGTAAFGLEPGQDDSALKTGHAGSLVCTNNDPLTTGMWTNGAVLSANLDTNTASGIRYLRYDFSYNLTGSSNNSGCVAGFAFMDSASNKIAGVALQYDVGATTSTPYTVTELTELTQTADTVAVVAALDLGAKTLSVWYNLSRDTSGFVSNAPMSVVSNLTLSSFDSLRFQATGDVQPAGSSDSIEVHLLRSAGSWEDILADLPPDVPAARYSNEWNFERDPDGRALSQTINSGTNNPLAQFAAGGTDIFTTNRALRCTGEDTTTNAWAGSILDAALPSAGSGVHYLRYDVDYDLSSSSNNSGTVLGVYFTGGAGDKAAGLVLGYDKGDLTNTVPAGRTLTAITNGLELSGTLIAVAEADLDHNTLKVWYSLNGSAPTNYASHNFTNALGLTSITNLRFHATGDFRPDGSTDYASVDNIRHTIGATAGGAAWDEIIEAAADLTAPPELTISVTNSLNGFMSLGETNRVTVIISNSGGPASAVTSILTNSGSASAFTITSNNTSVALNGGESVTNTYELVANERGNYTIYVSALSAETNTAPTTFLLAAGANLTILPPAISEPGGTYPGLYEPGETLNITITSTNDGAKAVSNIVNTLTAASAGFIINPSSANYSSLATGAATSTVYTVDIGTGVAAGTYTFNVTNSAGSLVWINSFELEVFIRVPNSDWVKANNNTNLDQGASWVGGAVPDATDRAVMDATVTSDINTALGSDRSFRGVVLTNNTAAWTITGTNTLTTGSAGIDLSQAGADLTIASKLVLATTQTWNVVASRTLTVSGTLSGTNTAPLIKSGEGVLALSGTNTYRGRTTVSNGTLSVGGNNALGSGTLSVDSATVGTAAAATLTNSTVLTGRALFDNANDLTLSGVISGSGSLTKTGAGILYLNGANTYSGGTTNAGTIKINNINVLGSGALVMTNGTIQFARGMFVNVMADAGVPNPVYLAANTTNTLLSNPILGGYDQVAVSGDITGPGSLTLTTWRAALKGNNTFSGGLNLNYTEWLWFGNNSLGSGPITTKRDSLLWAGTSTEITNSIIMNNVLRINAANQYVRISGPMSGSGLLQVIDQSSGTLELTGDNSGRIGQTLYQKQKLRLGHKNALGSGEVRLQPADFFSFEVSNDLTGTNSLANNLKVEQYFGPAYPLLFNLDYDLELSGRFYSTISDPLVIEKNGTGALILSGTNEFLFPINVNAGSLTVNSSVLSAQITMASGTTLSGTGTVQGVTMESGSTLSLPQGSMTFNGDLDASADASVVLAIPDNVSYASLIGNGGNEVTLGGILNLDFTGNSASTGETFTVLSNWGARADNGVTVVAKNLRADRQLDTSMLFVNGTVTVLEKTIVPVTPAPGDIFKADNSDNLNLGSSWTGGIVPGTTNRAVFHSAILYPLTTVLGADASWRGIALISNSVGWTISADGHTLTLGAGGIDMSQTEAGFTVDANLKLGSTQTWIVGPLRTLAVSGLISGSGSLIKDGDGTLSITGTTPNTYTGNTVVNGGSLVIENTDVLGTGDLFMNGGALGASASAELSNAITLSNSVVVNNASPLDLTGVISGDGSLTQTGSSELKLKGANTYSGGTTNNGWITVYTPQSLGTGKVVMNDGSTLHADPSAFISTTFMDNDFELNGATAFSTITDSAGIMNLSGDISGPGSLTVSGFNFRLFGNNTFSGGLNLNNNNWLYFENGGLGSGPITSKRNDALLWSDGNATISNAMVLSFNMRFRANSGTLTLAGPMSGGGVLEFQDVASTTIEIPNANPGRSGVTWLRTPAIRIGHETSLGPGEIQIFANNYFSFGSSADLTGAHSLPNNVRIDGLTYDGTTGIPYPVNFNLDHDLELSGSFTSDFTEEEGLPIEKNGTGSLILSGQNSYAHHINVNAGSLVISNAVFNSEAVTVSSGATLDLPVAPVFAGDVTAEAGSQTILYVNDDTPPLSGAGDLYLAGTLKLDFAGYAGVNSPISAGDTFAVIDSNWISITDGGLSVQALNLPPYLTVDDSNLFVDGTVTIVASRLSDQSLTITVPVGMSADGQISLTNSTGAALDFTLANNGSWPAGDYTVTPINEYRVSFTPTQFETSNTIFTAWTGSSTEAKALGFDFGVFGSEYSAFSVSRDGTITLTGSTVEPATIQPFQTATAFATNSIRYQQTATNLVVAWGVTNTAFDTGVLQAWINADGTIRYLYKDGIWGSGTIGVQNADRTQVISHVPGTTATDCLLLTPSSWITNIPEEGRIGADGSQTVTFTANATNQPAGETSFTASTVWSDGTVSTLGITVIVVENAPKLEVPNPFAFSGPVFTKAVMTVTNTGDADLTYTITDSGLQTSGYASSAAEYGWYYIPEASPYILSSDKLGTETIGIGFPFTFFGNTYSTVVVNRDGSISLGSGQTITPYSANLSYVDGVSSVRTFTDNGYEHFTVTWENMAQPGGGSQTFQAVLNRDGTVRFNYETMAGSWFNGTIQLSDPAGTVTGTLVNAETSSTTTTLISNITSIVTNSTTIGGKTVITSITTNYVITGTNVVVTYNDNANRQSLDFTPGQSRVICASPTTATVPAGGGTVDVTLCGDARSAGTGIYSTTLTFTYSGLSTNSLVTFTATNGVINPADLWGGNPAVLSQKNQDGSYTLVWQTPDDQISHIYHIWYTTSLSGTWFNIATLANNYRYVDSDPDRNALPVIFYKVTVE